MTATTNDTSTAKSNWGRWGDDDERGALNLLTPEVIKRLNPTKLFPNPDTNTRAFATTRRKYRSK